MRPVVSVICTVRNGAQTIRATLESIIAQEGMPYWEMIVVDDGSRDDTASVVGSYIERDERIDLIVTPPNGRGSALNLALQHAKAELVANIDADDVAHPRRLRLQYANTSAMNIDVLGTRAIRWPGAWPGLGGLSLVVDVSGDLPVRNPLMHSSVMMRRDKIMALGGYDERLRSCVDYDLWVRCADAGYRLARLDLPLCGKRIHSGQHFARLPKLDRIRTTLAVQRRAGATPLQRAKRAAWLAIPQGLRELAWRRG